MGTTAFTGVSEPGLVDLVFRVTAFPFAFSLWTGEWIWSIALGLIYHFVLYLPLRLLLPGSTGPDLVTGTTPIKFYTLVLPSMLVGAAILGAIQRRLLRLPHHLVPVSHLVGALWPLTYHYGGTRAEFDAEKSSRRTLTQTQPTPLVYNIYMLVALVLATLGPLAGAEIYAWLHGGGSDLDYIVAFLPTAATALVLLPLFLFNPRDLYNLVGDDSPKAVLGRIYLKLVLSTLVASAPLVIINRYVRNIYVSVMSGSAFIVGIVLLTLLGIYSFPACGDHEVYIKPSSTTMLLREHDDDE